VTTLSTARVQTAALSGVVGVPVRVEVRRVRRLPAFVIAGLPALSVRETADRVRSAITQSNLTVPAARMEVDVPAMDAGKYTGAIDLPIAVGILAASDQIPDSVLEETAFFGELALDGRIRSAYGILPLVEAAARQGCRRVVVPLDCLDQAAVVSGIEVFGARNMAEVRAFCWGELTLEQRFSPPFVPAYPLDLADVRGQSQARRALEVAAAGGHNLLMLGSPGCGKTMLAARMPGILPSLTFEEALNITRVRSVAGLVGAGEGLAVWRPFRAPHHSVSAAGMVGGETLLPGEVSLAHRGVLFLDEVNEFQRSVLDLLRGALEDRSIRQTRKQGSVTFPADFTLIAAADPCLCGFAGHLTQTCRCSFEEADRYRSRLAGPLLKHFDIRVELEPFDISRQKGEPGESSAVVRARVEAARAFRKARKPDSIYDNYGPTLTAASRLLRVARTIADLAGEETVKRAHLEEAEALTSDL
jgi:magnesium chelatase family protein